jgi:glycosyltransferase involved in cell wall biosynthesis
MSNAGMGGLKLGLDKMQHGAGGGAYHRRSAGTTSRRKILHVITDLDTGGAETMLARLATAPENTSENIVLSLLPNGRMAAVLRDADVEVVEANFSSLSGVLRGLMRLSGVIRRSKPDIVQGWMYHGDLAALLGLVLSGRWRKTYLVWGIRCSGMDFARYRRQLRLVVKACALFSRWPDAIIANSDAGMATHRAIGYRGRRNDVIANGVDLNVFRPDAAARKAVRDELGIAGDVPLLVHPARVDPMKDHRTFLDAMALLPKVLAIVIGAGTENLAVPPNVHRLGLRTDMPRMLAAADFVVSSSAFGEGFSNALLEGMACGLPAIATDVGAAAHILGGTGMVVPPRDAKALAAAIATLTQENRAQYNDRSRRARDRIAGNFSIEHTIRQFDAVYDAISSARAMP